MRDAKLQWTDLEALFAPARPTLGEIPQWYELGGHCSTCEREGAIDGSFNKAWAWTLPFPPCASSFVAESAAARARTYGSWHGRPDDEQQYMGRYDCHGTALSRPL